jgi:hypothetical protein
MGNRKGDILNFPYTKSRPAAVSAGDSVQRKKKYREELAAIKNQNLPICAFPSSKADGYFFCL